MRTSIVSLGLASAAYAKLALKENLHKLASLEGEGDYFGEDSMDWWVGSFAYTLSFEFGVKTNDAGSDIDANLTYLNLPAGIWLKLNFWDTNTLFDFLSYNIDNDLMLGEVAVYASVKGPIKPIISFDADGDSTNYSSTASNLDTACIKLGYMLNLLVNTYTTYSNVKTCRKSWMKFIASDFDMDTDKVCAFSYDTEGAIEDGFLTKGLWEHLIIDTLDGDQAEFDDLFGDQQIMAWQCFDDAEWFF